jgi:aspartyl-tRNA(Asn)/glutamyl-tRNA(Gln) amidotransferase subunit C
MGPEMAKHDEESTDSHPRKSEAGEAASGSGARATVAKIARLARLDIGEREQQVFGAQFERILEAFQDIARLDVEGVEPMTGPLELADVKRDDLARPCLPVEAALANAPARIENFYSVPKTIGAD